MCAWVAHTYGWIQIRIAAQELELNTTKATPKIGTTVRIEKRQIPSQSNLCIIYIVTHIYNEGDLAASKIDGDWKLSCSKNVLNRTVRIRLDHLGKSNPHDMEHQFGGIQEWRDVWSGKDISIEVDINFRYFGLEEQGEQQYAARYHYDSQQQQFVRE
jgi:hypothetical protein